MSQGRRCDQGDRRMTFRGRGRQQLRQQERRGVAARRATTTEPTTYDVHHDGDAYRLQLDDLILEAAAVRRRGDGLRACIAIRRGQVLLHRDTFNLTSAKSRRTFTQA